MFVQAELESILADKELYYLPEYSVITVYDDNFFVRNDYDILSRGQRNYLITFFKTFGFKQSSGKVMSKNELKINFPKPKHTLALSAYQANFNQPAENELYAVTPSTFAEVLFYDALSKGKDWGLQQLQQLINTCPYNIELIRDINYRSPIEQITIATFKTLTEHQNTVVVDKFKFKKAL